MDEAAYKFSSKNSADTQYDAEVQDASPDEGTEFLEEAHQALSKLFIKTSKRSKTLRGLRRKDAWQ